MDYSQILVPLLLIVLALGSVSWHAIYMELQVTQMRMWAVEYRLAQFISDETKILNQLRGIDGRGVTG